MAQSELFGIFMPVCPVWDVRYSSTAFRSEQWAGVSVHPSIEGGTRIWVGRSKEKVWNGYVRRNVNEGSIPSTWNGWDYWEWVRCVEERRQLIEGKVRSKLFEAIETSEQRIVQDGVYTNFWIRTAEREASEFDGYRERLSAFPARTTDE